MSLASASKANRPHLVELEDPLLRSTRDCQLINYVAKEEGIFISTIGPLSVMEGP